MKGRCERRGKGEDPPTRGNATSSAPLVPPGAELAAEPRGASSLTLLGGWRCSPSGLLQDTCHSGPPLRLMDERELHAPHPAPRKSDIASTLTPRAEDCNVRREAAQRQRLCLWSEKGLLPKARQRPLPELCGSWGWEESHPPPAWALHAHLPALLQDRAAPRRPQQPRSRLDLRPHTPDTQQLQPRGHEPRLLTRGHAPAWGTPTPHVTRGHRSRLAEPHPQRRGLPPPSRPRPAQPRHVT